MEDAEASADRAEVRAGSPCSAVGDVAAPETEAEEPPLLEGEAPMPETEAAAFSACGGYAGEPSERGEARASPAEGEAPAPVEPEADAP